MDRSIREARSAIRRVVPDFGTSDSSKGEGHFNEKKKKLNQVRREESSFEFSIDESIYFVLGIVHLWETMVQYADHPVLFTAGDTCFP